MSTDAELTAYFKKFRKPLRSWMRNKANIPLMWIDDLSMEVFLRLMKYPADSVGNPAGYLFRIATNVCNEWRERSRNANPHSEEWLDALIDEGFEQEIEDESVQRLWRARVEQLLTKRQQMILWQHIDGLTYKQIAAKNGLTYRIVLRDLTRAYTTLRMSKNENRD